MKTDEWIGRSFRVSEFCFSQTAVRHGIAVELPPGSEPRRAVEALVKNVLQPVRNFIDQPIMITSGYRPPALNTLIGGSVHSQHRYGEAADIVVPHMDALSLARTIRYLQLPFDQLILEFGRWVHVSYTARRAPRGESLTAIRKGGRVEYHQGLRSAAQRPLEVADD